MRYEGSGLLTKAVEVGTDRLTQFMSIEPAEFDVPMLFEMGAAYDVMPGLQVAGTYESNNFEQDKVKEPQEDKKIKEAKDKEEIKEIVEPVETEEQKEDEKGKEAKVAEESKDKEDSVETEEQKEDPKVDSKSEEVEEGKET